MLKRRRPDVRQLLYVDEIQIVTNGSNAAKTALNVAEVPKVVKVPGANQFQCP